MTLRQYLICGIPWTIYALTTMYVHQRFLTFPVLRFLLCFVSNLALWPVAILVAAFVKLSRSLSD